jgi:transcriptional regulator with PAS, ATPase and Fis domain
LFGHVKGAFTDAYRDKSGLFEVADKGTLFLDEITEMSPKMQVKLLRTLQEKTIRRVGGHEEIKVDARIIAATNKDLQRSRSNQEFREDLYYRLNVISIHVPPLRERKSDIPLLMEYFLQLYAQKFSRDIVGFEDGTVECFLNYPWPGNVRELENVIERGVALGKDRLISKASLPAELVFNLGTASTAGDDWKRLLGEKDLDFNAYIDNISKKIIVEALEMNGGNMKKTTGTLKMSYRSLRYLVEKYNLKYK